MRAQACMHACMLYPKILESFTIGDIIRECLQGYKDILHLPITMHMNIHTYINIQIHTRMHTSKRTHKPMTYENSKHFRLNIIYIQRTLSSTYLYKTSITTT